MDHFASKPTATRDGRSPDSVGPVRPAGTLPPPPRRTTWTLQQNITRLLWSTLGRFAWVLLPPLRSELIRLFGGTVGRNCAFARSVDIIIPWNLHVGDNVQVGEKVILYALGIIKMGNNVVIDYKAHLCAGTHDMNDPRFALLTPPITIGAGCFIGIDAYIGPGVTLGDNCRVWPRASVYKSQAQGVILRGNPARPVTDLASSDEARAPA